MQQLFSIICDFLLDIRKPALSGLGVFCDGLGFHEFVLLRIVYIFHAVHEVANGFHFLVFGESDCHTLAYCPVATHSVKLWSVVVAAVYKLAVLVIAFNFEGDGSVHGSLLGCG